VLLVLAYHVWPGVVPGGYVGVDVFFVISGYLITGVLLAGVQAEGRVSFAGFYTRRIKRLLPAATCVLLATAFCTPFLPDSRRLATAIEIAAGTLYAENIWLAHQARDYLAADDPASPVQHYWSLSVEEQFYIVWPMLLWLAVQLAPRARVRPKAMFGALIGTLLVATLAYGIWLTATASSQAYFSTVARAWELALGGMWAARSSERSAPSTRTARWPVSALGIGGVLGIGSAALLFDSQTPFPGYAALLPTLGACAIIAAGSLTARWPGDALLCNPVLQYIGDRSYSLYLWHWPVLVLIEARTRDLTASHRLLIVAISLALAHATKRWVEDPCRSASFAANDARRPFALAGLSIVISLSAANFVYQINAPDPGESWGRTVLGARALEQAGYDFRRSIRSCRRLRTPARTLLQAIAKAVTRPPLAPRRRSALTARRRPSSRSRWSAIRTPRTGFQRSRSLRSSVTCACSASRNQAARSRFRWYGSPTMAARTPSV